MKKTKSVKTTKLEEKETDDSVETDEKTEEQDWRVFLGDLLTSSDSDSIETVNEKCFQKKRKLFPTQTKKEYYQTLKKRFLKSLSPDVPNRMLWITFNFKDSAIEKLGISKLPTFFDQKILRKRCFQKKRYTYSVEQREEKLNNFKGYHIHLLIERPKKSPSHLSRELYQALKDYVGNSKHIDIKYYNGCDVWREKLAYLEGNKEDPAKKQKTLNDQYFRRKYHFRMTYSSFD